MAMEFWKTKYARLFLTILSVVLCIFSSPGNAFPLLALVCFVPLGLAIHGAKRSYVIVYSSIFGLLGWLGTTKGLADGLALYNQLSPGETLLHIVGLCMYLSIPYMLFGVLYGNYQWMKYPFGPYKTAACLTILVSIFPTPLPFSPANFLYTFPALIQILDIGGEPFLLFVLCLFNWLLVDLILKIHARQGLKENLVPLVLLCVMVPAYGYFRLSDYSQSETNSDETQALTVAVLQPNIPLGDHKGEYSGLLTSSMEVLMNMSRQTLVKYPDIELIVWPETPDHIGCEKNSKNIVDLVRIASDFKTSFLINCVQYESGQSIFNTALLIKDKGEMLTYHKQKLIPFAEYLPGEDVLPFLRNILPGVAKVVAGDQKTLFGVKDKIYVFAAICYEVLFANHVREFIEFGGNAIINPANDAWFGASTIPEALISSSAYRAVEFRVPVIRVSNSGNSLVINSSGKIVPGTRTRSFIQTVNVSRVFVSAERSFYYYSGNLFLYVLTLSFCIDALRALFRNKTCQVKKNNS